MKIILQQAEYEKMIKQARAEFPHECCGLLAGQKAEDHIEIQMIFPMVNVDGSSEHFTMDPKEQFAVVKKVRNAGLQLIGNYHSHPYTPSRPSGEDIRLAHDPDFLYGILSLEHSETPVLHFFYIHSPTKVTKLEIEIKR